MKICIIAVDFNVFTDLELPGRLMAAIVDTTSLNITLQWQMRKLALPLQ